jgi:hypothetical protein
MITIFYRTKEKVDAMHDRLKQRVHAAPTMNAKYGIYRFFVHGPEDRVLEFQCFLHPVDI